MEDMYHECIVCHIKDLKIGKHYGAVTCLSCRAFFRRGQERKRSPKCKFSSSCPVDQSVGKHCPKCRYQKCIRVGMQPELVLSEEEKKERFKVSLNRKNPEEYTAETSVASTSNSSVKPVILTPMPTVTRIPIMNVTQAERVTSQSSTCSANMSSNYIQLGLQNIQLAYIKQEDNMIMAPNHSSLKSESGKEDTEDVTKGDEKKISVANSGAIASTSNDTQCRVSVIRMLGNKSSFYNQEINNYKIKEVIDEKLDTETGEKLDTETGEKLDKETGEKLDTETGEKKYLKTEISCSDSEMILQYIHKKFGKGKQNKKSLSLLSRRVESSAYDTNLAINHSFTPILDNRKRKSVIVQNFNSKLARKYEHSDEDLSKGKLAQDGQKVYHIKLYAELPVMKTLATRNQMEEESCFLNNLKNMFEISWNEISLGEEIVGDYINFCQNRKHFKLENWEVSNRQFRERYLNFVCSLEMMEDIPMKTLFALLKQNLSKTQMLTYVFAFNAPSWVEELEFVYGANDKEQWKARDPTISGIPMNTMMQFLPLPESDKLEMTACLLGSCMPTFRDKTVLILMVLVVMCDMEGQATVSKMQQHIYSMLSRYLQKTGKNDVQWEMQNIVRCIQTLPTMMRIFSH